MVCFLLNSSHVTARRLLKKVPKARRAEERKMQSFGQRGNVYVVIGAKGGTGAEIVKRLLERPAAEVWRVSSSQHATSIARSSS
jgi:hypothetical protein